MKPRDIFLAMIPPAIWGFSFVAIKIGLQDFSAPQLSALRFLIAALPVFFVPIVLQKSVEVLDEP